MATDATGAPTPLGIPKYNTSADAPSGLGFNAAMDALDALIAAKVSKPAGIVSGEAAVWNGSSFDRSSVTKLGIGSLPITRGNGTSTFTASATAADVTITHGLGVTPSAVLITTRDGAANAIGIVRDASVTSTQFVVILRDIDGVARTGTNVFNWVAVA